MKYYLAENAGFCFGVREAIRKSEEALKDSSEPVYSYGEITHNRQEMARLRALGLKDFSEADGNGKVIIRAHGIGKEEYEYLENHYEIINTTCPFVKKIHHLVQKYETLGYTIVIVGNPEHPEVVGSCGWAEKPPIVIDSLNTAKNLSHYDKICILAQTTIIKDYFNKIVSLVKRKCNDILVFNTICNATTCRQQAAAELSQHTDGMIVVGGYHSSNTQKLYEICKTHCKKTWYVETAADMDIEQLKGLKSIGITAGASTPNWIIKEVMKRMDESKFNQNDVEVTEETQEVVEPVDQVEETVQQVEEPVQEDIPQDEQAAQPEETADSPEASDESITETEEVQFTQGEEPVQETSDEVIEIELESPTSLSDEIVLKTPEENAIEDEAFDFASAIDNMKPVRKNMAIEGEVLEVKDDEVILNIGYKSDGVIYKRNFTWRRDEDLRDLVHIGDKVEAIVVELNDGEGRVNLSKIKFDNQQIQDRLGQAYENQEILYGKVKSVSGSGLMIDIGFTEIFMPASQYHLHYVKDLESLIGNEVRGIIIDYNPKRRRAILSQKYILQEERKERQRELDRVRDKRYEELPVGTVVDGKVKTITDFGIFVDLSGIDGFIHRSDLTWLRQNEPKSLFSKGETIKAKVISRIEDGKKIKLSIKELQEKPWDKFVKQYAINDIVDVTITNIKPFGAFAQIIPGVEGLIHISEISFDRIEDIHEVFQPGEIVQAKIIDINTDLEKISLSKKATLPKPDRDFGGRFFENKKERSEGGRRDKRKNRRSQNNRHGLAYQENSNYTIGDSFSDILESLNYDDEEIPEEEPVQVEEEINIEEYIDVPTENNPVIDENIVEEVDQLIIETNEDDAEIDIEEILVTESADAVSEETAEPEEVQETETTEEVVTEE